MDNSMKRQNFLQKMLRKSDDELDGEKVYFGGTNLKVEYSPRNKPSNWTRNLDACSPSKSNLPTNVRSPSRPITLNFGEYRNDNRRKNAPEVMTPKSTTDSEGVPNIERIRREFEMGFLSPTKQDAKEISTRSGRFVKKIVAAFEEKYKTFNDSKVEAKQHSRESTSSSDSSFDDDRTIADMMEESMALLSDTYVIESLESRLSRYLDSYIATSSVREEEEEREESPSDEDISLDLAKCSFAMDEELSSTKKNASLNRETSGLSSERSLTRGATVKTMLKSASGNLVRSDSSLKRERKPKIVGAYLKKPIEVEDTSVDWIPIPGKNLPRKRSFKRLLSILTGKKSSGKSSKHYYSEINLQEETTKEILQDSGYDEKSGSSSSLVSLVSINDLLLQQKHQESATYDADYRVPKMTTFGRTTVSSIDDDIDNDNDFPDDDSSSLNDAASDTYSVSSTKKILFEEVSRSELRLSLGPSFPSAMGAKVICSLDRRDASKSTNKNLKNNWTTLDDIETLSPPLPKHPFVSAKKKSNDQTMNSQRVSPEASEDKADLGFSEFDSFDLSRGFQTWTFPTEESEYDVPRRYFSKSEPGLVSIGKQRDSDESPTENVYDVPKPKLPRRPRSSIYEDALSLKRRNEIFANHHPPALPNEFYGFSCNDEPHYATIKPRNTKIHPSKELLRSLSDLNSNDLRHNDYYYYYNTCVIEGITV